MRNTPGTKKYYRISVYDLGEDARWLESADFTKRPLPDELTPDRLPKLNRASGGRFEIRVGVIQNREEHDFYGWTETRPAERSEQ
jgi:hypothetical protein